jgi:hypothetical protein
MITSTQSSFSIETGILLGGLIPDCNLYVGVVPQLGT